MLLTCFFLSKMLFLHIAASKDKTFLYNNLLSLILIFFGLTFFNRKAQRKLVSGETKNVVEEGDIEELAFPSGWTVTDKTHHLLRFSTGHPTWGSLLDRDAAIAGS